MLLEIAAYLIEQILAHPEVPLKDLIGIHWTFDKLIGHQTFAACNAILEYYFSIADLDHSGDGLGCCCQEASNKNFLFKIPEEIFEVEGIGIHREGKRCRCAGSSQPIPDPSPPSPCNYDDPNDQVNTMQDDNVWNDIPDKLRPEDVESLKQIQSHHQALIEQQKLRNWNDLMELMFPAYLQKRKLKTG
ncbi:hypothetical protein PGT21_019416 [Puccinia graminis f. sp. tritici]|uniref:Uncharacterized protein n=1 Tax=Puccinia graminis f. sp. tritici TaxID=56615 RepID=A0A5B0N228_PUCGR|nr:hypothetical protein PGT21_019416 [Puccinia graminis f. sp. tritici]